MGYTIKVQLMKDATIEISGDDIPTVVKLLNAVTKKFYGNIPAAKIEIWDIRKNVYYCLVY